jgi:hypothetical protein
MRFAGDGLSERVLVRDISPSYSMTANNRSEQFELPSLFNIGGAYDYKISEMHRVTGAVNFTSHSFTRDEYQAGLEYAFRNLFMVRGGYSFIPKDEITERISSAYTGPTFGFSVELPLGKGGKVFGLDYSYRVTDYFDGTHAIGAKLAL